MIDEELLKILACPVCKGDLEYREDRDVLICKNCRVYYEIKDGIPVLLPDSGRPLREEES
ncbi:MAG: Trm112 family protein [Aquificota bacterium]|nr:Trm112 family protein [Aquificota bacterium]